jgi:hypothetical protein
MLNIDVAAATADEQARLIINDEVLDDTSVYPPEKSSIIAVHVWDSAVEKLAPFTIQQLADSGIWQLEVTLRMTRACFINRFSLTSATYV